MSISFLLPHLQIYGGVRRFLELANHLTAAGHDASIYHSDGSPCLWMDISTPVYSLEQFRSREHDVIIYALPQQYVEAKRPKARRRFFYVLNLYNRRNLFLPLWILKRLDKRAYWTKKGIIDGQIRKLANCSDISIWLNRFYALDVPVIFGGINKDIFHPLDKPRYSDSIRVLTAGSDKYWKGTDMVARAVELAKQAVPNIQLNTYHDKGIPQKKMAEVYGESDVFVDAQYYAGWNNPVAEAMACKVPVVCGDMGFNKDIAINDETALMVPVHDPEAYASAIIRLIEDPELRRRLTENAYRKISEFTWESATDFLLKVLNSS